MFQLAVDLDMVWSMERGKARTRCPILTRDPPSPLRGIARFLIRFCRTVNRTAVVKRFSHCSWVTPSTFIPKKMFNASIIIQTNLLFHTRKGRFTLIFVFVFIYLFFIKTSFQSRLPFKLVNTVANGIVSCLSLCTIQYMNGDYCFGRRLAMH